MASRLPPVSPTVGNKSASGLHVVDYPLKLQGTIRLFTNNIPMDSVIDLSKPGDHQTYTYFWIDETRGAGAHVAFSKDGGPGTFNLGINLRQSDPDLLKVQSCMRMRDESTNNIRTTTLAVSVVDLGKLLSGEEDQIVMSDQFIEGNFCYLTVRLTNASDYGNFKGASAAQGLELTPTKPFIQLRPSSLRNLKDINEQVVGVSTRFGDALSRFNVTMAKGGDAFYKGVTRSLSLPSPVIFVSLALGTPAYALVFPAQPGIRRQEGSENQRGDHPAAPVPLCNNECPGGMLGKISPFGSGSVPCVPQDPAYWPDSRVHPENGRHSLWSVFRAGSSHYMRRWTGAVPARY